MKALCYWVMVVYADPESPEFEGWTCVNRSTTIEGAIAKLSAIKRPIKECDIYAVEKTLVARGTVGHFSTVKTESLMSMLHDQLVHVTLTK